MFVCVCNGITDKQIRSAVASGASSVQDLKDALGVASQCGTCFDYAEEIIAETRAPARNLRQNFDDGLYYAVA
ncbi:MAG: bacterioferritin-associated ferredoxin [Pseudomonadota bacterium]